MAATPEGRVKDAVKRWLKKEGTWSYMPVQNGMGVIGIPDIIGCRPVVITEDMVGKTFGQFVAIETKAPGRKYNVSPNQRRNLDAIAAHGGVAVVADKVDDVKEAFNVHVSVE